MIVSPLDKEIDLRGVKSLGRFRCRPLDRAVLIPADFTPGVKHTKPNWPIARGLFLASIYWQDKRNTWRMPLM